MEYEQYQKTRTLEEMIGDSSLPIVEGARAMMLLRVRDHYLVQYAVDAPAEVITEHREEMLAKIADDITFHHQQLNQWNVDHLQNTIPEMRKLDGYGDVREDLPDPAISYESIVKFDKQPPTRKELEAIFTQLETERRIEMLAYVEEYLMQAKDNMHYNGVVMPEYEGIVEQYEQRLERLHEIMRHEQIDHEVQEGFVPEFSPDDHAALHTGIGSKLVHVAVHALDTSKQVLTKIASE